MILIILFILLIIIAILIVIQLKITNAYNKCIKMGGAPIILNTETCGEYMTNNFDSETGILTILSNVIKIIGFAYGIEDYNICINSIIFEPRDTNLPLEIGTNAFYYNKSKKLIININAINIPPYVSKIDNTAFFNNIYLKSIHFEPREENNLTIHYRAFAYCTGLTELIIPKFVTFIQNEVFSNCTQLNKITFLHTAKNEIIIERNSFYHIDETITLFVQSEEMEDFFKTNFQKFYDDGNSNKKSPKLNIILENKTNLILCSALYSASTTNDIPSVSSTIV